MAKEVKRRRGTALEHESFIGAVGEITVVTDDSSLRVHDNVTVGGHPVGAVYYIPVSGKTAFTAVAGIDIAALRVVIPGTVDGEVIYADHTDVDSAMDIIGITKTSATAGNLVEIITGGSMEDPSWNWSKGPVFLGTSGVLTQTAPITGFVLSMGKVISNTKLNINIDRPIILI